MYILMRQDRSLPEHEHVKAPGGGAFGTGRGNVGSCAAEAGLLPQPGSTERHMRCLQQQPLLRVQKGGLGGGDAKEGCIKCVDACMVTSAGLIQCGGFSICVGCAASLLQILNCSLHGGHAAESSVESVRIRNGSVTPKG